MGPDWKCDLILMNENHMELGCKIYGPHAHRRAAAAGFLVAADRSGQQRGGSSLLMRRSAESLLISKLHGEKQKVTGRSVGTDTPFESNLKFIKEGLKEFK